jgi:hypothetical protein
MKRLVFTIFALLVCCGCGRRQESGPVDKESFSELKTYLIENYMTPEDYVIGKLDDHDVVFIGEMHRVKHDVELIHSLIPCLHENGIHVLVTEFARMEDQPLIDSLLAGEVYDERLARQIIFNQYVHWGFREYVDLFKTAWELNRSLADGEREFRVLGWNCSPDWSIMKTDSDRNVDSLRRLAWRGCSEKDGAEVILEQVDNGEKVVVYSGMHHSFTEYRQPVVIEGEFVRYDDTRVGNYVYARLGKRAITICLHHPWEGVEGYGSAYKRPVRGVIDMVMDSIGERYRPIGFDVNGSPLAEVVDTGCIYSHGYESFTVADFCDGYIYHKPFREYENVALIEDFVNEQNLQAARRNSPNPNYRNASAEDFRVATEELLNHFSRLFREL